jgi:hypothetical protein
VRIHFLGSHRSPGAEKSFAPSPAKAATQPASGASHCYTGVEPASVFGNRPNFPLGALITGFVAARWDEGNTRLCAGLDFASTVSRPSRRDTNNENLGCSPILEAVHAKSPRERFLCVA